MSTYKINFFNICNLAFSHLPNIRKIRVKVGPKTNFSCKMLFQSWSNYCIISAVFLLELVKCPPLLQQNGSNHENCNIKLPTHFVIKLPSVKFLFRSLMPNKSVLKQKSKYLSSIKVFPFLFHFFL